MKNRNFLSLIFALVFLSSQVFAAVIADDTLQLGKPGSTADKTVIFGASNKKKLSHKPSTNTLDYEGNSLSVGDGTNTNKTLRFNKGSNSPSIRWNSTTESLEFSNDNTNFSDIGSGAGGGSGVNLITKNAEFEQAVSNGWTNSGGTFSQVTSGSNLLFGKGSATFTASASGQFFQSDLYTVPEGLGGKSCLARIFYKGGGSNLTLKVLDASSQLLAQAALVSAAVLTQPFSVSFFCPAAGQQFRLRLESTGASPLIAVDRTHLGEEDRFAQISQAKSIGVLKQFNGGGSCFAKINGTGGEDNFANLSGATGCSTPTVEGEIQATTPDTFYQITIPNARAGNYYFSVGGFFQNSDTSGNVCHFTFTDGATKFGRLTVYGTAVAIHAGGPLVGSINFTTPGTKTITIQASSTSSADCGIFATTNRLVQWDVQYFPSGPNTWFAPENGGLSAGDILQTASLTCPTGTVEADGSAVSRLAFPALFAAIGTTYGVGDGSTTFNLPNAQGVFLKGAGSQTIGGNLYSGTQGTTEADQMQGHVHQLSQQVFSVFPGGTLQNSGGVVTYSTLNTNGPISDGVNGTPRVGTQTRPANISVKNCIRTIPASASPVLVGDNVKNPSNATENILRFYFDDGAGAACTTGTCRTLKSNSAGVVVTSTGTGTYTVNFPSGIFSNTSFSCTCQGTQGGGVSGIRPCFAVDTAPNQIAILAGNFSGGSNILGSVICMGPK